MAGRSVEHADIIKKWAVLEAEATGLRTDIAALTAELKASQDNIASERKRAEQLKQEEAVVDKEIEFLLTRQKSQGEQKLLLEEVRSKIQSEIFKEQQLIEEKKKEYNANLEKYNAIWIRYEEIYSNFPLVRERNEALKRCKLQEIKLKIQIQKAAELKKKVQQMDDIRERMGKILKEKVQKLHQKEQEALRENRDLTAELEEVRARVEAKRELKRQRDERLAKEEQERREREAAAQHELMESEENNETSEISDMNCGEESVSSQNVITLSDVPVLNIPDLDDIDNIISSESLPTYQRQLQSLSQDTLFRRALPTIGMGFLSQPVSHFTASSSQEHFSPVVKQKPQSDMSTTFSVSNSSETLHRGNQTFSTSLPRNSSIFDKQAKSSFPSAVGVTNTPVTPRTSSSVALDVAVPVPSPKSSAQGKREHVIQTDEIAAKMKDAARHLMGGSPQVSTIVSTGSLAEQRDTQQAISGFQRSQDMFMAQDNSRNESHKDANNQIPKAGFQGSQDMFISQDNSINESHKDADNQIPKATLGSQGNEMSEGELNTKEMHGEDTDENTVDLASNTSQDANCNHPPSAEDAYMFDSEFDAGYPYSPPPFRSSSSVNDCYASPIASPGSPELVTKSAEDNPPTGTFGPFSFFGTPSVSTGNLFGVPTSNDEKDGDSRKKQGSKNFFLF